MQDTNKTKSRDKIAAFDERLMRCYWAVAHYVGLLENTLADWQQWQAEFEAAYLSDDYATLVNIYESDRWEVARLVRQYERSRKIKAS